MFEITPDDISKLDDSRLRTLVGLLCEAELRSRGYSTSSVTWGGDQNATDGGVDVRVSLTSRERIDGFIPRNCTGFQVKRQDMPRGEIAAEMRPRGKLRPVIRELADQDGAYIIVSSLGSTSDSALENRRRAIAESAHELAGKIHTDFYDQTRLASWVRNHAGLVVWVRTAIGRAIPGWQGFGPWAYPPEGVEADYLLDDGVRIRDRSSARAEEIPAGDGLDRVREILRTASGVVRLVGLSGVGKTRFAQALFDDRIRASALDPALAVYTNMSDEPDPQPVKLASDLIANRARAVMIVDNCPPNLHARLAELVKSPGSGLSVVTIEYDIRDDLPEGTEVYELRAASVDLVEKLLRIRFPSLSGTNARTAAVFSGGNARIAVALARTVSRNGTLAKLTDVQLVERLFAERQGYDRSLLEMAQACALVYSFNAEDLSEDPDAELHLIARLVGSDTGRAHGLIAELLRRELAQRRGKWRAILPHAIANHLAANALENIPIERVEAALTVDAPKRLAISFARRLGYLDTSVGAQRIVERWLAPDGWIGQHVWSLDDFGQAVFRNCLPAAPGAGLLALEAHKPQIQPDSDLSLVAGNYIALALRSLSWDADLFERCARLLRFLVMHGQHSTASEAHTSLFHLHLSGTHAPVEQRVRAVRELLQSGDDVERNLGLKALRALLHCNYFTSHYDFQFGSHSRDYGYQPKTYLDVLHWYRAALSVASEFALTSNPVQYEVREIIAANFRNLWTQAGVRDELESLSQRIAIGGFWCEGWRAVKLTRFYDEKDRDSENYAKLTALESALRPRTLVQRARAEVFASSVYDLDEVDDSDSRKLDHAIQRQNTEVLSLAVELVDEPAALDELMPEIVSGGGNVWHFGMGLARATRDPRDFWNRMVEAVRLVPEDKRDLRVLNGFLLELAVQKSPLLGDLLDEAVENESLAPHFPQLQPPVLNVPGGIARLMKSLDLGKAPLVRYRDIQFGSAVDLFSPAEIANFILAVSKVEDGTPVAIRMLGTQFFSDGRDKRPHAKAIVDVGRIILSSVDFLETHESWTNDVFCREVIDICILGDSGRSTAYSLCENMRRATLDHTFWGDCYEVLKVLARLQPGVILDTLSAGDRTEALAGAALIKRASLHRANPLDEIPDEFVLRWCREGPASRYLFVASVASMFDSSPDHVPQDWRPLATKLVHEAPESIQVMSELVARLRPLFWSEALSTVIRENAALLSRFDTRDEPLLASFIRLKCTELLREAIEDEASETKRDRNRDERFE